MGCAAKEEEGGAVNYADVGIYFVQVESGPIKIGHSREIRKRVMALQIGSHEELRLLAVLANGTQESDVHACFIADHIRGEWFKPSEALLMFIERVRVGEAVVPSRLVTVGAQRLAEIIMNADDSGAVRRVISRECGCTEQAVRNWAAGTSAPLYRSRKLLAVTRGIDVDAWDKRRSA